MHGSQGMGENDNPRRSPQPAKSSRHLTRGLFIPHDKRQQMSLCHVVWLPRPNDEKAAMPMLIHPIDAIARKKGRDVLFLSFSRSAHPHVLTDYTSTRKQKTARKAALAWLKEENIAHVECMPYWANGLIHCSYEGHVYIDVPPIESDKTYRRILDHFEFADGTRMRNWSSAHWNTR